MDDDTDLDRKIGKRNNDEDLFEEYQMAIVAVGDEKTKRWMEKLSLLGFIIPTLIHPTAFIPEGIVVGNGTVICA